MKNYIDCNADNAINHILNIINNEEKKISLGFDISTTQSRINKLLSKH